MNKIIKITSFLMLFMFIALYKCNFANAETATCVYGNTNNSHIKCTITSPTAHNCEYIVVDPVDIASVTWGSGSFSKNGYLYCPKYACGKQDGIPNEVYLPLQYDFLDECGDGVYSKLVNTAHSGSVYTKDTLPSDPSSTPSDSSDPGTKISSNDDCEGIYGKTLDDMKAAIKAFKIIGPIMVMVYTVVEYLGAVTDKDADKLKKANQRLISRFILLLVLFFLPDLINIILKLVGVSSTTNCLK